MKKGGERKIKEVERNFGKYIFGIIMLVLIFLSYKILAPFLVVLLSSFIFAYLVRPLYTLLSVKLGKNISAIICILIVILVIIVPIGLVMKEVVTQSYSAMSDPVLKEALDKIASIDILKDNSISLDTIVIKINSFVVSNLASFASILPNLLISFFILLFSMFYMLVGWSGFSNHLKEFLPFENKKEIVSSIQKSTRGIVYGYFMVALIKFAFASIGFYLVGVKLFFLFAFIVGILSFIPGIGSPFVVLPLLAFYAFIGNWATFFGVLVVGAILMFYMDLVLPIKILSKEAKIHPLIMVLGVIGGTALFGLFGFIIGPLILVYTIKLVEELIKDN